MNLKIDIFKMFDFFSQFKFFTIQINHIFEFLRNDAT